MIYNVKCSRSVNSSKNEQMNTTSEYSRSLFICSVNTHLRIYFALTYQLVRRIHARRRRPHVRRSPRQPCPASARPWVSLQEYKINERNEPEWKAELILQVFKNFALESIIVSLLHRDCEKYPSSDLFGNH